MRIGVIADGYVNANGTLDYLKIILRALYLRQDTQVVMFFSSEEEKTHFHHPLFYRKIYGVFHKYTNNASTSSFEEFNQLEIVEYSMNNLKRRIKESNIDVIFPTMINLGWGIPVPWAIEFFDCQPKYYPQYFKWYSRIGRDLYYILSAICSTVLFVNSQSTRKDYCRFYGTKEERIKVLPFCATLDHSFIGDDIPNTPSKYGITKPYFLISNQFYPHKRHDVAFKALSIVRSRGYDISIVCTGLMKKRPDLIVKLKSQVRCLGLDENVLFLGAIPKKDQIEIMKQAISVLQPSEFEGDCSGQIIDAITIGQRVLASDIDVIKEVSFYDSIDFFKLDDENDLANKMIVHIKNVHKRPSLEYLIKQEDGFLNSFSETIYSIIDGMLAAN